MMIALTLAAIIAWPLIGAWGTVIFWNSVDTIQGGDGVEWRLLTRHDRKLFVLSSMIGGPVALFVGLIGRSYVAWMRWADA